MTTRINAEPRMTQAVLNGDTVHLLGQVASDRSGNMADQSQQILATIGVRNWHEAALPGLAPADSTSALLNHTCQTRSPLLNGPCLLRFTAYASCSTAFV
jgi:hypothetical protein